MGMGNYKHLGLTLGGFSIFGKLVNEQDSNLFSFYLFKGNFVWGFCFQGFLHCSV